MTCIVTDGKTIAGDGLSCREDLIVVESRSKLFHGKDGSAIGCAGDATANALAREWFEGGEDKETIPALRGADFLALVLRPDGRIELFDKLFTPFECDAPAAIGSGEAFAIGAMLAGADPKKAVEIAAQRCTTVGGKVTTLKPKDTP